MNTSAIRRFGYVAGASATALMLVEACSDAVGEMMVGAGNMMADAGASIESDAGELLSEAGQALVDAGNQLQDGGSDGQAQSESGSKSGSRIQMRLAAQDGADGSRYVYDAGPFDTMLNVALREARQRRDAPLSPLAGLGGGHLLRRFELLAAARLRSAV